MRTERLLGRYRLQVVWAHFPLHPEVPDEGMSLNELFAGREKELASMRSRLEVLMEEEGLPYGDRVRTVNSRRAQELAAWAESLRTDGESAPHPIHDALFRAYFVDDRNLADPEVLVEIAAKVGLPTGEARRAIEERAGREVVDRDWDRSRRLGLPGVPAFVAGRRVAVGAQPYEVLERLVVEAGAVRRDDPPST